MITVQALILVVCVETMRSARCLVGIIGETTRNWRNGSSRTRSVLLYSWPGLAAPRPR